MTTVVKHTNKPAKTVIKPVRKVDFSTFAVATKSLDQAKLQQEYLLTRSGKAVATHRAVVALHGQMLTGKALLEDMRAFKHEVTASPETAHEILVRVGVMTKGGKAKKLIRG